MILQYFVNKENQDKKIIDYLYKETIHSTDRILSNNFSNKKKEFNLTFEISALILIVIFAASKHNKSSKFTNLKEDLLSYFIKDLDHSLRILGISDNSIGTYVKKYVKKIYYRIPLVEKILLNQDIEDFLHYLLRFKIINNEQESNNIKILFKDLNILTTRAKKLNNMSLLFKDLFK